MIDLFNPDMARRVADLQGALETDAPISVAALPEFAGQPKRVVLRSGSRVLTFSLPMAEALGAQLVENGYGFGTAIVAAANG